jgi:molybdate transport system substrate-binding protein
VKSICKLVLQVALFVGLVSIPQSSARTTEMTFLCAAALEAWMDEVLPEFQNSSGYGVKTTFERINIITERVRKGDDVDLAIVSPQQWEGLQQEGKLDPRVRVVIAKVGFGVFVKKGAAKPDVSSVEAFKRAFLNARSIASFSPSTRGPTVIYQDRLFERLDLTVDLNSRIKYAAAPKPDQVISAPLFELVANGDAEIGLAQISETLQAPGVELVGPVPAEIQNFTIFTTAIPANGKEPTAAKALIDFLTSPKATSILKSMGLEEG